MPQRHGLGSQRSIGGGLAILAVVLLFALVLPVAAAVWPGSGGFDAGRAYPITSEVSFTPERGWERDAGESTLGDLLVADKGSASITITPSAGSKGQVSDTVDQYRTVYDEDDAHYHLGKTTDVTTDGDLTGSTFTGAGTTRSAQVWVLYAEGQLVVVEGVGGTPQWPTISTEVESMVDSIVLGSD